jgi:hypothetical protein
MSSENLIKNLANKGAKSALPMPAASFVLSVMFLSFYLVVLLDFFGVREDFSVAINTLPFQIELFLNIGAILFSIAAITFLRLPSLHEKSWVIFIAIILFILLFLSLCFNCCEETQLACASNLKCLMAILLFSIVPLIFLTVVLRRGVMTNYFPSFLLIGIASGSFSYLVERLMSPTEDIAHLLLWHFAPIFIVILLSALLIKKFARRL